MRRALKEEGWDVLTADEKRFTMLDRVLRPDLYLWMRESERQPVEKVAEDGKIVLRLNRLKERVGIEHGLTFIVVETGVNLAGVSTGDKGVPYVDAFTSDETELL